MGREQIGHPFVSIIVPALNEAPNVRRQAIALSRLPEAEAIFVDGGSCDGTLGEIESSLRGRSNLHFIKAPRGRARQMNAGAQKAKGEWLIFLHADTILPLDSFRAFLQAARNPSRLNSGAFTFRLENRRWAYRYLEFYVGMRSKLLKLPFGDQAIFVKRCLFQEIGGYREDFPLMEDVEIVQRLNIQKGFAVLNFPVYTSARRYEADGFLQRGWGNLYLQLLYKLGVHPRELAKKYWKRDDGRLWIADFGIKTPQSEVSNPKSDKGDGMTDQAVRVLPVLQEHGNGRHVPTPKEAQAKTWERLSPKFRTPSQSLGQRKAIGCVAVEITQRCNLDCTLCYLSEMSESTLDIPMEEVKRRIDEILYIYGPNSPVQITGGDPTLRQEDELIEIVRYASSRTLQPALLTNGIKATRALLQKLAAAGLRDVAFHVDMTQQLRKPNKEYYQSEEELNVIRKEYIERARGLGIAVIFNTTLCCTNFHELPMLVRFFRDNADGVGMCSFQLQADTGRGVLHGRPDSIEPRNLIRIIDETLGRPINFDVVDIGHPSCNRIGYSFVCNRNAYDLWWDPDIINKLYNEFEGVGLDRGNPKKAVKTAVLHILKHPRILLKGLPFLLVHLWRMKWDLIKSRFKVYKLSFFIHNFMHAECLDPERIDNCAFMVMTPDGPMSMCLHNAHRDAYITKEFKVNIDGEEKIFNPVREHKREYWAKKLAAMQKAAAAPRPDTSPTAVVTN